MQALKLILGLILSVMAKAVADYFKDKDHKKAQEAERERDEAVDAGNRIANRADDAGELRDKFAKRANAANQNNHSENGS